MSQRKAAEWFWYIGGDQDGFCYDLMADTITWVMWDFFAQYALPEE